MELALGAFVMLSAVLAVSLVVLGLRYDARVRERDRARTAYNELWAEHYLGRLAGRVRAADRLLGKERHDA